MIHHHSNYYQRAVHSNLSKNSLINLLKSLTIYPITLQTHMWSIGGESSSNTETARLITINLNPT